MGREATCRARFGRRTDQGKVLLESDHLLFRGDDRVKIMFKDVSGVRVAKGWLTLQQTGGSASFELGSRAERWAARIVDPPSLLDKLGVKPNMRVTVPSGFDQSFSDDLVKRGVDLSRRLRKDSDIVFVMARSRHDLSKITKASAAIVPAGAIWVVYPKGRKELTENDVLAAGRVSGLTDNKVASFSATDTALRFVIPVARRQLLPAR